jgi:hypothetical protein
MKIAPATCLKACFAAGALLALSACNTTSNDRAANLDSMNQIVSHSVV